MIYSLNDFVTLLHSQPELPVLATAIAGMLANGYSKDTISDEIETFCDKSQVSESYEDSLDDIISAMEGFCSKDYMLHPSNFSVK